MASCSGRRRGQRPTAAAGVGIALIQVGSLGLGAPRPVDGAESRDNVSGEVSAADTNNGGGATPFTAQYLAFGKDGVRGVGARRHAV